MPCNRRPMPPKSPEVREMPPQSHTTQGFAGVAVEIDLILKGIKTYLRTCQLFLIQMEQVEIDLILKGIKTPWRS